MMGRTQTLLFLGLFHYMVSATRFSPNQILQPNVGDDKILCIERERQALLKFKQGLIDTTGRLSSWDSEDEKKDCCTWSGVRCNNQTGHVVRLDLGHTLGNYVMRLEGKISSSLLELQHLNYLDLSNNDFNSSYIPKFIGSLSNLRYLDLSFAKFSGAIPYQLGNLSSLQSLSLGYNWGLDDVGNLEWLSHLSSLKYLDLSSVNLSKANDWPQVINKLPYLKNLQLLECELPNIPHSLSVNFLNSTSLVTLDLSGNNLNSSIYHWLFNFSSSVVHLDLRSNFLEGSIPDAFGSMTSLAQLRLSDNQLGGGIPKSFKNLGSLHTLVLRRNNLTGPLSGFTQNLSECTELQSLDLSENQITGPFPDLTRFSLLKELRLSDNRLHGTLPKSIGRLTKLEVLDVARNSFEGVISEAHLSNLSNLQLLHLSSNHLAWGLKSDWVPPFQLNTIELRSCKLGPSFPKWLPTQNSYFVLDISDNEISDNIPYSFWNQSSTLIYLNLSCNQINGTITDLSPNYTEVFFMDLSSNHFEGPVPPILSNVEFLNLSKNKLSGSISFLCAMARERLTYLDLSNNLFSGKLPDCWMNLENLEILNLANNNFSGKIPNSMGFLHSIETLQLRNNSFIGNLPSSLRNCRELRSLDVGGNKLSGMLPAWVGDSLSELVLLSLTSNQLHGSLPVELCHLTNLQVLDLSLNNIPGNIPKCLNNLTAIAQKVNSVSTISHGYYSFDPLIQFNGMYDDSAVLMWKGNKLEFRKTLGLVKSIDLSSNKLTGEIPREITELVGLVSLNLSRNNLTGKIPPEMGRLSSLDALDLSRNELCGEIPPSLTQIDRLGVLDLSHNNLSGKIPIDTQLQSFNASAYSANHELCGLPLPNKCPEEEEAAAQNPVSSSEAGENGYITPGFYLSMALGFAVGFWGVCGTLLLNRSCRHTYFNFLNKTEDWLQQACHRALNVAKLQRRHRN